MAGEDKISCGARPRRSLISPQPRRRSPRGAPLEQTHPGFRRCPRSRRLAADRPSPEGVCPCPSTDFVTGLKCRVCGKLYPKAADQLLHRRLRPARSRLRLRRPSGRRSAATKIEPRPRNMWRYRELLPLDGEPTVGPQVGGTPLVRADRLAEALGVERALDQERRGQLPDALVQGPRRRRRPVEGPRVRLHDRRLRLAPATSPTASPPTPPRPGWKRTSSSRPTWSGRRSSAPASTGRRSSASHGTYDEVNRLCTQIAFKYGWGFVNVNLRPFYAEGSKTIGFEIAEDLGWRFPQHVVCPMAGGSLIGKIHKAFSELHARRPGRRAVTTQDVRRPGDRLQPDHRRVKTEPRAAQAGPQAEHDRQERWRSATRPTATSPRKLIRETGGWAEDVTDDEIVEAMLLLAETEGIFAETAGGVTRGRGAEADRAGPHPARRGDRPLHHRQRPEDAGRGGRRGRASRRSIKPSLDEFEALRRRRRASRCWCKTEFAASAERESSSARISPRATRVYAVE